jgi:hypothetical protein
VALPAELRTSKGDQALCRITIGLASANLNSIADRSRDLYCATKLSRAARLEIVRLEPFSTTRW